MVDEPTADDRVDRVLSARAERALAALLALEPDAAERVRERSPARRRPRPQYGPQLDLGTGATAGPAATGEPGADDGSVAAPADPDRPA